MRQKKMQLIIAFSTTTSAMAAEKYFKQTSAPGRLIPVPVQITAGCGLAWCSDVQSRQEIAVRLDEAGIKPQGVYELIV